MAVRADDPMFSDAPFGVVRLDGEGIERHAVRQRQDLGVGDGDARKREGAGDARKKPRMIGRIDGEQGRVAFCVDREVDGDLLADLVGRAHEVGHALVRIGILAQPEGRGTQR